jgi:RimJ/RimL family protein N-acetyltransferase
MIPGDRLPTLPAGPVCLRWLDQADVAALHTVFSDPAVMRYWSSPPQKDIAAAEQLLAQIHTCFARRELFQWGIARTEDDLVIGTCTLASLDPVHRRAELGFALGTAHWGRGYARAATSAVLDFAFDALALHRLEADVDPRNAASIALLERLGFTREGHLRERWHVAGEICDGLFYGLLARDWRALRDTRAPAGAASNRSGRA